jgi:dTDP-4-amino-4,6-dideoxygalactose transaminase
MIGEAERQAVLAVLEGPTLVHGPRSREFEAAFAAYTGAKHAIACSSCTAGLHLYYFARGYGPGDEVIVPAQTHTATAHAVELVGATPVFVDAEPVTGNIDLDAVEAAITERTKAISVVHYLGRTVDMTRLRAIADRRGLPVLEDCALAIGSRLNGVHAGLLGDAGSFSFYPVKHITTAEGGMVITNDDALAAKLRLQRAFSVDRTPGERTVPGVYDVVGLGLNYRMNEIQAALGEEQLRRVDSFLAARRDNYQALSEALGQIEGLTLVQSGDEGPFTSSHYCLSVLLDSPLAAKRLEIINGLKARGVGTSIYYPRPVPHMTYYREKYGFGPDSFPVAARLSNASIALPVGPHLTVDDMAYITNSVEETLKEVQL